VRLCDLRESVVEVFVVARVQDIFVVGFDSDGAVAVELNFFCGVCGYVALVYALAREAHGWSPNAT